MFNSADRMELYQLFLVAFPSRNELKRLLYFHLGKNLDEIAAEGNLQDAVLAIFRWAEATDTMQALITAAAEENPRPDLQVLARRYAEMSSEKATTGKRGTTFRSSSAHAINVLPEPLYASLVDTLLRVSSLQRDDGRSVLLTRLLGQSKMLELNRHTSNTRIDLEMIIQQLHTLGRLSSSGEWSLLQFIMIVLPSVEGSDIYDHLLGIKEELQRYYQHQ